MGDFLEFLLGITMIFGVIVVLIFAPILGAVYYGSCRSAAIYNAQHHSAYTCSDFFWAADQINAQTQTIHLQSEK